MMYDIHMKRTNLVLNEHLLEEATRMLGEKTYSAAVNTALAEVVRIRKILSLPSFLGVDFGKAIWRKCEKTAVVESRIAAKDMRKRSDPCGYLRMDRIS